MDMTIVLGAALTMAIIVLSVVFALSRRVDRLTEALLDLRQLHVSLQETQTDVGRVVAKFESVANALTPLHKLQQEVRESEGQRSELMDAFSRTSVEWDNARATAAALPDISAGLSELQKTTESYHLRMDKIQAAVAALATAHGEQQQIRKLLKTWGTRIDELQQMSASVPAIKAQQAQIQSALLDWSSRFDAAARELDRFMESEWQSVARVPAEVVIKST